MRRLPAVRTATRRALLRRSLAAFAVIAAPRARAQPARKSPSAARVLLVVGDSLSAEYGLVRDTGWVRLLEQRLAHQRRQQYIVANASISGETTSGGRARLPSLLARHRPALVVIQLGANDGLRGLPLASMRDNLRAMIEASQAAGARVLLVAMRIPPNYGRDYAEQFHASFAALARETNAALAPFLLQGFAADPSLFQADRIHPNEAAQPRMLDNVWPQIAALLAPQR